MTDEIDQALANLEAIKSGETQDTVAPSRVAEQTVSDESTDEEADRLKMAQAEVDRLAEESEIANHIDRSKIHVGVANWKRKNGICKYHRKIEGDARFGKRMRSIPRKTGHHTIVINERLESDDEFIDTVRHELAHAVAYAKYGESQKHNHNWKRIARQLGADDSACHNKSKDGDNEYKYYIGCPNCGMTGGRRKRSKIIKQPFNRKCNKCGERKLVSYDAGDEMPEENGTVAVESLDWNNKEEWIRAGRP